MLALMVPHSRVLWIEGRKLMNEGEFEESINYLHGALVTSPPGNSREKFCILLDFGYALAATYDLCSATPILEKAFAMVNSAPDNSSKAQLYNNLAHCYLEDLIDEMDVELKKFISYQALACVGIAKEHYYNTKNYDKLWKAKELEEEIRRESGEEFYGSLEF